MRGEDTLFAEPAFGMPPLTLRAGTRWAAGAGWIDLGLTLADRQDRVAAARAVRRDPDVPMVCLATAHPAKFPDAVEQAIGIRPALPDHLADLLDRPERFDTLPLDQAVLQHYVAAAVGATGAAAAG